ncbi:hypothetical protein J7M22_08500 [Candidatus Poribacteria bacterium]|nr:hypothetical protein [Candidatus Poribacteria bacterium]
MSRAALFLAAMLITALAWSASDVSQIEVKGEATGEFTSPFMIPQGFTFPFNYHITTQADISILDLNGTEVQSFQFKTEGVSIGEHKSFQLKKGDYTVRELYSVTASPDNPLFQGQDLKGEPQKYEWSFTASDDGTYDLSISAVLTKLTLTVSGDLELKEIGDLGESISVQLATTRNVGAGEKIKYTAGYIATLSKTSTVELVSKGEGKIVTFIVTGAVKEKDGTVIPNAEVTVELPSRSLSQTALTDDGGIYKATFSAPEGTVLAEPGDTIRVSYGDFTQSYTLSDEDVSRARAVVNLTLEREPQILLLTVSPEKVKNGDTISITIIGDPGFTVKVDLSKLDSTKPDPIPIPELIPGQSGMYLGEFEISPENSRGNGIKVIRFDITDKFGNSTSRTMKVELENPAPAEPPKITGTIGPMKLISPAPLTIWAEVGGDVTSVSATLISPSGEKRKIELSDPDGDGRYEGELPELNESGLYTITILASGPGGEMISDEIRINTVPWDINSDGGVDIFDLVMIGKNYGRKVSSPQDNAWSADVNSDGKVDILDLVLVGKHYGERLGAGAPPLAMYIRISGGRYFRRIWARLRDGELHLQIPLWAVIVPSSYRDDVFARSGVAWIGVSGGTAAIGLGLPFETLKLPSTLRIVERDLIGIGADGELVGIRIVQSGLETKVLPNYPNPFNPETWVPFELSDEAEVRILIYGTNGRLVREIDLGRLPPGSYIDRSKAVRWDGRNQEGEPVSSGVYIYRVILGEKEFTGKMLLMK